MRRAFAAVACLAAVVTLSGCYTYESYYSLSNSRKLLNSEVPLVAKIVGTPFVMIPESVCTPVQAYMDSSSYPPTEPNGKNYLSYRGWRTLIAEDIPTVYKVVAAPFVLVVDTAFFPFVGAIDIFDRLGDD